MLLFVLNIGNIILILILFSNVLIMEKNELAKIVKIFEQKKFKNKLTEKLNKDIDIPIINEKTEKKIMNKIYDVVIDTIKNIDTE